MKKIFYFIVFSLSFLCFKNNAFAYVNDITYDYDSLSQYISDSHYELLSKIQDKFKGTNYHYFVTINPMYVDSNSTAGCTSESMTPTLYDQYCNSSVSPINDNGLSLFIFNPIYNDKIFFSISTGISGQSRAFSGFFPSDDNVIIDYRHYVEYNDFARSFYITDDNLYLIDEFLSNPSYGKFYNWVNDYYNVPDVNLSTRSFNFLSLGMSSSSRAQNFDWDYTPILFYKNFKVKTSGVIRNNVNYTVGHFKYKYDDSIYTVNANESDFPFYLDLSGYVVPDLVHDFGNNTFGFYNNLIALNATSLTGATDTLSVICETDKPFVNDFCNLNYLDLINKNSNINYFNNFGLSFTQLFGENSGYLVNNKYYLYSFRINKPFVPSVGNLFINSLSNDSFQISSDDFLKVYMVDGGSYTDYVIKFKLSDSSFNSESRLNDIMVVFRNDLGSYYRSSIPETFNFGVYRSFKLQYFDEEPTDDELNNFVNYNDLDDVNNMSSQSSFFTDTDFNSFGFAGIITFPFRFLYAFENFESCTDIRLPFPHSDKYFTLACVRRSIPSSISPLITILQVILSGFVCYRIAVGTLKIIKEVSSPDDANIEVVDL